MLFKGNPYHLFLPAALLLMLTSLVINDVQTVDIHIHDTYFVIAKYHTFWLLAFVLGNFWMLYVVTRDILFSGRLSWWHTLVSIGIILGLAGWVASGSPVSRVPVRPIEFSFRSSPYVSPAGPLLTTGVLVFMLSQLIFIINLLLGIVAKLKTYK